MRLGTSGVPAGGGVVQMVRLGHTSLPATTVHALSYLPLPSPARGPAGGSHPCGLLKLWSKHTSVMITLTKALDLVREPQVWH